MPFPGRPFSLDARQSMALHAERSMEAASRAAARSGPKKMAIGVGDRQNPQPGGTGKIYIDDICLTKRMP